MVDSRVDSSSEHALAYPHSVVVNNRDLRWTLLILVMALAVLGYLISKTQRQELTCSRTSGTCVVQERNSTGRARAAREVPLSEVTRASLYKLDAGTELALQGIALNTARGEVRLAATQPCAPGDIPCPGEQADALRTLNSFLRDGSQPNIRIEYGGESQAVRTLTLLIAGYLLFSLLGWERVRLTVLPSTRQVVVTKRRAFFFRTQRVLRLDAVRKAVLVETRMGIRHFASIRLALESSGMVLVHSPSRTKATLRFVDEVNAALESARQATTILSTVPNPDHVNLPIFSSDPILLESHYRGWTRLMLFITGAFCVVLIITYQKAVLHCSRSANRCTLLSYSSTGIKRTTLNLDEIEDAAIYTVPNGKTEGLELLTHSAPVALPAMLACANASTTHPCYGDSWKAYVATIAFLRNPRQPSLDASYGSDNGGLLVLGAFFLPLLLATLLQWQSVRIEISRSNHWFSLLRRRALFFTRHFELPLSEVQGASFDEKRDDEKARVLHRAQLRLRNGERIWLDRAWSEPSPSEKNFVAQIDAALAAARKDD